MLHLRLHLTIAIVFDVWYKIGTGGDHERSRTAWDGWGNQEV